jgi:hypothetical protein
LRRFSVPLLLTPLVPATVASAALPKLVEGAGRAARFAWDEFFYAEHQNPHTQKAYERAMRRFLDWAEGQGVELVAITPGMVGQYRVALRGSTAKRDRLEGIAGLRVHQVDHHADAEIRLKLILLGGRQGVVLIPHQQIVKAVRIALIQAEQLEHSLGGFLRQIGPLGMDHAGKDSRLRVAVYASVLMWCHTLLSLHLLAALLGTF